MKEVESGLPFNYKTIKVTHSRINKGLLAIPISLIDYFPKQKTKIYVAAGIRGRAEPKNFTPYTSSSRECRIGGMRSFYERFSVQDGNELVVQFLDTNKYRILTEEQFRNVVRKYEAEFDRSTTEREASSKLRKLSEVTNTEIDKVLWGEYYRLSRKEVRERKHGVVKRRTVKENVPAPLRRLLGDVYEGKCQISGFGFLTWRGKPYFEMHHIRPKFGNHVKNLLVVSPNVHAQFTHASVVPYFDTEGWLRKVWFNQKEFHVNHLIDKISKRFTKEVHYEIPT